MVGLQAGRRGPGGRGAGVRGLGAGRGTPRAVTRAACVQQGGGRLEAPAPAGLEAGSACRLYAAGRSICRRRWPCQPAAVTPPACSRKRRSTPATAQPPALWRQSQLRHSRMCCRRHSCSRRRRLRGSGGKPAAAGVSLGRPGSGQEGQPGAWARQPRRAHVRPCIRGLRKRARGGVAHAGARRTRCRPAPGKLGTLWHAAPCCAMLRRAALRCADLSCFGTPLAPLAA